MTNCFDDDGEESADVNILIGQKGHQLVSAVPRPPRPCQSNSIVHNDSLVFSPHTVVKPQAESVKQYF